MRLDKGGEWHDYKCDWFEDYSYICEYRKCVCVCVCLCLRMCVPACVCVCVYVYMLLVIGHWVETLRTSVPPSTPVCIK